MILNYQIIALFVLYCVVSKFSTKRLKEIAKDPNEGSLAPVLFRETYFQQ